MFFTACLWTLVAGFLACVLGMRLALRWGWVDRPDQVRKWHARPVPVVGGVAVFSAFFSAFLWDPFVLHSAGFFLLSTLGFLCLGFVDDVCLLSPRMRLGAQLFFVLLALVPSSLCVRHLGFLWGHEVPLSLPLYAAWPFTLLCFLGFVNAMNMLDGQDGLLVGVSWVQLAVLAFLAAYFHLTPLSHLLLFMLCALAGCFYFNAPWGRGRMASLFMGDAGSTSLGFVMAWATVSFSQHPAVWHHFSLFALPWVFAVPLLDMFSNFFRRFLEGGSPFQADTGHVHHLLRRAGLTVRQSTFVLVAISAFLGLFAVFSSLVLHAPSVFLALAFLVLFAVYAVLSYYYNKVLPSMEAATQLEASHEAVLTCQEV